MAGVDSFTKALEAMENGQGLPLTPPTGQQDCPVGRVRMGIFFDGTGNNKWVDEKQEKDLTERDPDNCPNGPTNVVRLYRAYQTAGIILDKAYHHGVGTDWDGYVTQTSIDKKSDPSAKTPTPQAPRNWVGQTMGVGGKARIDWGLRILAEFFSYKNKWHISEKYFDVCGFSRGAGLARDFVNQVKAQRIADLEKPAQRKFYGLGTLKDPDKAVPSAKIEDQMTGVRDYYETIDPNTVYPKFMAIFDTVEAWGAGTGDWLPHVDHCYVEHCVHMIAEDEFRSFFPVTSIFMDPNTDKNKPEPERLPNRPPRPAKSDSYQEPRKYKKWMLEIWYPGCHSDIGGSYLPRKDKRWHLQFIMLRDMHKAMKKAQVPINNVSQVTDKDLPGLYSTYCGFRQNKDWALHVEQDLSHYIHWYETDEYMARFFGVDEHPDLVTRGTNAGLVALGQSGGGMGGGGYVPPPPPPRPPPDAQWPARLRNMPAREHQQCVKDLVRLYIHDSATETTLSSFRGEAMPKDGLGRLRLQRKVIPSGAQPKYVKADMTKIDVRDEHRPPRSTF